MSDPVQQAVIPVRLLYPAGAAERVERFGPYELNVAMDAPPEGNACPVVVISHGRGGSSLTYRDLAMSLARTGFVVALPEHPGNNRLDNSLDRTIANLENRPRHVRLVLDALFADPIFTARLSSGGVAVIGHSIGGYTALALAGGRPTTGPYEREGPGLPVRVVADPRVRALVLFAPACGWFWPDRALADVDVPILLLTAEKDAFAADLHVDFVRRGVRDPDKVESRVIPNAGHFSFHSPFPLSMRRADFPPSQDPEGFDRAAFQPALHAEVMSFLTNSG